MDTVDNLSGLAPADAIRKRLFDLVLASIGLIMIGWVIPILALAARFDTGESGIFRQTRIGRGGVSFQVLKLRTMRSIPDVDTTVTSACDPRITKFGKFLRKFKLDELPQLVNIIRGDMSFVGPRPDVAGFADQLSGADRIVLSVRPGITGPATIKYRDEEILLSKTEFPERYNRDVIFPDKVRLNREYILNYRFSDDILYICKTLFG